MRFHWLAFTALVFLPGMARADFFVFNATTDPMTGVYIPVGSGYYNHGVFGGDGETFFIFQGSPSPAGTQNGTFSAERGVPVPPNPNSSLPCVAYERMCLDTGQFFSASDGSSLGFVGGPTAGVSIYDASGNLLGFMQVAGFPPIGYHEVSLYVGINGPIDISALPLGDQTDILNYPKMIYTGGIQDAIDVQWYDGAMDSFEIILSTPEPASLLLFSTILVGIGVAMRRKFRPLNRSVSRRSMA